jgi:hypothetical protein
MLLAATLMTLHHHRQPILTPVNFQPQKPIVAALKNLIPGQIHNRFPIPVTYNLKIDSGKIKTG